MSYSYDFLVAICPDCGVPWPSFTRKDLRLLKHPRHTREKIEAECPGSLKTLSAEEYGENDDDRFAPPHATAD